MSPKILVVDDEKLKRMTLRTQLEDDGYQVDTGENGFVGLEKIKQSGFDVVITDLRMPSMDGISFLREIKKISPETEVIMMTGYGTIENAVEAMKEGAYDYLSKPFPYDELSIKLRRLLEHREGRVQIEALQRQIQSQYCYRNIIGRAPAMRAVFEKADVVADSDTTILIEGETGTGKEMMANVLHYNSHRKACPFIKLSCAVLNREILESELFGHEKGAFTGAMKRKRGRFELADKGTIFLDEVDDIPFDLQVKLLRVIQERTFERVGGEHSLEVDVRVICATKKDLWEMVEAGNFREDLYYRLNVVKLKLPPLRERREDILLLAEHFLQKFAAEKDRPLAAISAGASKVLLRHSWPGNVRELENVIEHAVTLCQSLQITAEDLPEYLREPNRDDPHFDVRWEDESEINFSEAVSALEKRLIFWAMKKAGGKQARAAELLKIPRTTLRDKLAKLNLTEHPGLAGRNSSET